MHRELYMRHPSEVRNPSDLDFYFDQQIEPSWRSRTLVVDDDDIVRAQIVRLLKRSGYRVRSSASGEQALRALEGDDCQMILTDWQMPDMTGIELCRAVRCGRTHSDVYMMMLTVRDSDEDRRLAFDAGADDYIVKGAPLEHVLSRLNLVRRITAPLKRSPARTNWTW